MERHYFADYEAYCDGQPILWGQLALTWNTPDGSPFDPVALLDHLRRMAAARCGVDAHEIRVRGIARL